MIRKLFIAALLFPVFIYAQHERQGSADAQFLKIEVSPRAAAMGGAYIAVADGAEAVFYNPAALARISGTDITFTHTAWFAGINHEFASIAHSFDRIGTFAVSMTALYTDEMKVRTPLQPDGTGETFFSSNFRAGLSYGCYLTDRVTFGGTINYIHLSLYSDFTADAYSIDISTFYVTEFRDFRFGMMIANFGSDIKFVNESYPLPVNFTFGASMNAVQTETQKLLVSLSAVKPNDGQPQLQIGSEWNYNDLIFIRFGYKPNHDTETFSFGSGVPVNISGYKVDFDYSYSDLSLLGASHRLGISAGF